MGVGCIICMESFGKKSRCVVTLCGHLFHNQCIVSSIKKVPKCPTCDAECDSLDLLAVYCAIIEEEKPGSLQYQKELETAIDMLIAEHRQLNGQLKSIEHNKNQKISALEVKLRESQRELNILRNKHPEHLLVKQMQQVEDKLDAAKKEMSQLASTVTSKYR